VEVYSVMTAKARLFTFAILISIFATPAWAQRRVPHKGSGAIGGDVGIFLPRQDGMDSGPVLQGFYESYFDARNSVRLGVEWANPKVERQPGNSIRLIRIGGDLLHNWEGGSIHPFVGAGLGAYFLQARNNGHNAGDSQTKLGGTLIGGVEFFTSDTFSIKGEARYHMVMKSNGYNPSGLALTIGAKTYF